MKKLTLILLTAGILFSGAGCGTFFFSHRMGKKMSTVVDDRVFYGNCFLCLFGIIPGVVAFILDYENGTIYYTEAEMLPDDLFGKNAPESMKSIPCSEMDPEVIAQKLSRALGKEISSAEIRSALAPKASFELL